MRRWAELHLDVGQRELEEEMGVLAGLSTADGLFDVELKGKDRQTDTGGASSSIRGLKLFQRSDPSHLYMVSAFLPPYFFRGWFMKLRERDLKTFRWDNCCSRLLSHPFEIVGFCRWNRSCFWTPGPCFLPPPMMERAASPVC